MSINRKRPAAGSVVCIAGAIVLLLAAPFAAAEAPARQDPRLAVDSTGKPAWARSLGRLHVPVERRVDGRTRHFRESCSATLLGPERGLRGFLVLTAWHCLDGYEDLSRPIRLELPGRDGNSWTGEVTIRADGGGMGADWALLSLRPLPPAEFGGAALASRPATRTDRILMAGHSRDSGLGAGGRRLTYDANCRITGRDGADRLTDCVAFPGASGGAVFLREAQAWTLAGVISRGDRDQRSVFVPLARFMDRIESRLSSAR